METSHQQPYQKKPKKGFFQTLFCCLGKRKNKGLNQEHSVDGSQYTDRSRCPDLLPPVRHQDVYKKCMVIDLDETLVHSSFKVRILFSYYICEKYIIFYQIIIIIIN